MDKAVSQVRAVRKSLPKGCHYQATALCLYIGGLIDYCANTPEANKQQVHGRMH